MAHGHNAREAFKGVFIVHRRKESALRSAKNRRLRSAKNRRNESAKTAGCDLRKTAETNLRKPQTAICEKPQIWTADSVLRKVQNSSTFADRRLRKPVVKWVSSCAFVLFLIVFAHLLPNTSVQDDL